MADARLARCPRCSGFTLVAERQGIRLAVDVAAVDAVGYGTAVAGGVGLWWVENRPGRGSRVVGGYVAARRPSWAPGGSQNAVQGFGRLHAEHSCGASARDMIVVEVVSPKASAPATPGAPKAGSRPNAAPAGASPGREFPSRAGRVSPRPFKCSVCNRGISDKQEYSAIECGTYAWACHEECE